ncbi:OsmC family protein [Desulfopila sp. IMCC35006]|uniref:OsmC family protein n=1 Tax=Desulfopila sp. IMCC35006 TaxID=2569542 RepID=UPI00351A12EF
MTLRMYAERKNIALESIQVELSHQRITGENCADCQECERQTGMLDEIGCKIHLTGDFDEAQHDRLLEIARHCPVHRTLTGSVNIRTFEV